MKLNFCKLTRIEHLILEVYTSLVNVRGPSFFDTASEFFLEIREDESNLYESTQKNLEAMYYIVQNLDGIDHGYQSHQFLTESDV